MGWKALVAIAVLAALAVAAPGAWAAPPPHEVEEVQVSSFDGVKLDGWIVRPTGVPQGTKLPIVLWSAPYFGQCNYYPFPTPLPKCGYATGENPELYDNSGPGEAVPVNFLLENGYAVAIFNVRGTGNSGGCFDWFGAREQRDQYQLVEWLGTRSWSNGNVGMMGLSYHGTTPWEAAIQNPPHLKTIIPSGIVSDPYLFSHTPQGATFATTGLFDTNFTVRVTLTPPINGPVQHYTLEHIPVTADRLCPEVLKFVTEDSKGSATDLRDEAFWRERRLMDRFPGIEASVFLVDGFQDHYLSGHQVQANEVWNSLKKAPKRMLVGQWAHSFPNFGTYNPKWTVPDWNERVLGWLDYWLKGIGDAPPREGIVDYQEGAYEDQETPLASKLDTPPPPWHESSSWPPADTREEVLYLRQERLTPASGDGESGTFEAVPQIGATGSPKQLLCPETGPRGDETSVTYLSEPAQEPIFFAGNPFAYLRLSSDLPGGIVSVHLFDLAPEFICVDDDFLAHGVRYWAAGAADLRFHEGNMTGRDFPTGRPTPVRIDITDFAEVLQPGHRLAAVVSRGDPIDRNGQSFYPNVRVHADGGQGASHLVLPVVCGGLGGAAPTLSYPPRPFLPSGERARTTASATSCAARASAQGTSGPASSQAPAGSAGTGADVLQRPCTSSRGPRTSYRRGRASFSKRRRLSFRGNARGGRCGGGIKRVEVALAKRSRSGPHARRGARRQTCRFADGRGRLGRRASCRRRRYVAVRGTTRWGYTLRRRLPPGHYKIWARGVTRDGFVEAVSRRNVRTFKVR